MSIFTIEPGCMSFCMEKGGTVTSKLIDNVTVFNCKAYNDSKINKQNPKIRNTMNMTSSYYYSSFLNILHRCKGTWMC